MFGNTFLNKLYRPNNYLKQKKTKYFLCQLLDVGTLILLCTLYAGNNISKTVRTFIKSVQNTFLNVSLTQLYNSIILYSGVCLFSSLKYEGSCTNKSINLNWLIYTYMGSCFNSLIIVMGCLNQMEYKYCLHQVTVFDAKNKTTKIQSIFNISLFNVFNKVRDTDNSLRLVTDGFFLLVTAID